MIGLINSCNAIIARQYYVIDVVLKEIIVLCALTEN